MSRLFPLSQCSAGSRQFSASGGGSLLIPYTRHKLACGPSRKASVHACLRAISPSFGSRRSVVGFTLIELLVVIAIIAILAALTLSTLGYVNKKGAESRARAEVAALSAAIESFKLDRGAYPADVASLYTNLCSPVAGAKVYFEPSPGMVTNNRFVDPWGSNYEYTNNTNFFELWSTAGGANSNSWIRN